MEEYPQYLYTRYPKRRRRLQDLPNELLLNIFRLGCDHSEIEPRTDYAFDSPPHPRKRKHFIAAVRLVCYRWQKLVDLPSLPYGSHFWFARISLSLRDPLEPFATSFVDTNSFIRRLGDFQSRLSSSKGCDLVIEVDTGGVATSVRRFLPQARCVMLLVSFPVADLVSNGYFCYFCYILLVSPRAICWEFSPILVQTGRFQPCKRCSVQCRVSLPHPHNFEAVLFHINQDSTWHILFLTSYFSSSQK